MQGHERSGGMSKSEMGLQSLGQGSRKRYGTGMVGQGRVRGVPKTELRFVDGIRGRRSKNKFGSCRGVDQSSGAVLHGV